MTYRLLDHTQTQTGRLPVSLLHELQPLCAASLDLVWTEAAKTGAQFFPARCSSKRLEIKMNGKKVLFVREKCSLNI